ncbi:MAG TPA: alpha-L-arabinofuranosidase C-terminal domain-containing protein, partial [Paenibacillus sp.]|nr:alpha-L-arabinofuranosidase C-terminal domain-containing protein [Paenibacillus sp.]
MKSTVVIKPNRTLGAISPYIYGQYFEHLEDCIYPSVWDDRSPHADESGLRKDVIRAAAELAAPVVRWPGGCFADLYHWEDGIGPGEERPVRRNWHWGGLESNRFGTDEFLRWCELTGADPYVNFNLGTGTLDEALRWMDYCIGTEPTKDALQRAANGREKPYDVKLWGIGNETWGPWEAGQMDAEAYAKRLANWCEFVRKAQPDAGILAVGSEDAGDPEWDRAVLETAGKYIDYLTLHTYACSIDRSSGEEYYPVVFTADYMASRMRKMRDVILAAAERTGRPIRISVDEWNIRHYVKDEATSGYKLFRRSPRTMQDAVFVAGVLNAMVRLSPHVGMANYVFLVNGNGVMNVDGERVVRTPLYHVFRQYALWMRGEAVEVAVDGPMREAPPPQIRH